MNQGTIFRRPDNPDYPYFVIAQSEPLESLNTRVIIRLYAGDQHSRA